MTGWQQVIVGAVLTALGAYLLIDWKTVVRVIYSVNEKRWVGWEYLGFKPIFSRDWASHKESFLKGQVVAVLVSGAVCVGMGVFLIIECLLR